MLELTNLTLPVMDKANEGPGINTRVIQGAAYVLPPYARYICDDVHKILDYTSDKFDLIVMDPPWQNKHVRRKKLAKGSEQGWVLLFSSLNTVIFCMNWKVIKTVCKIKEQLYLLPKPILKNFAGINSDETDILLNQQHSIIQIQRKQIPDKSC